MFSASIVATDALLKFHKVRDDDKKPLIAFIIANFFMVFSAAYNILTDNQNILAWGLLLFVVYSILYYMGTSGEG